MDALCSITVIGTFASMDSLNVQARLLRLANPRVTADVAGCNAPTGHIPDVTSSSGPRRLLHAASRMMKAQMVASYDGTHRQMIQQMSPRAGNSLPAEESWLSVTAAGVSHAVRVYMGLPQLKLDSRWPLKAPSESTRKVSTPRIRPLGDLRTQHKVVVGRWELSTGVCDIDRGCPDDKDDCCKQQDKETTLNEHILLSIGSQG
ncbi:hypothetical protein PENSPDRAFT_650195 [Peniophora sp. CONT]|nr:hypothetical protein PENSPDRAFT_650195 [Peniophora sp. CONT]